MKVGIIGSGKVGHALGSWIAAAGDAVSFTSRDPKHAEEAAQKAGHDAKAAALVADSEPILLMLPFSDVKGVLEGVRNKLDGKTVVDVTNPVPPTGRPSNSVTRRQAPKKSRVNSRRRMWSKHSMRRSPKSNQARRTGIDGHAITIFFAGDDAAAKDSVRQLILRLGFDAVDAGPLVSARCLEPLSLLNIRLGRFLGFGTTIGFSLLRD